MSPRRRLTCIVAVDTAQRDTLLVWDRLRDRLAWYGVQVMRRTDASFSMLVIGPLCADPRTLSPNLCGGRNEKLRPVVCRRRGCLVQQNHHLDSLLCLTGRCAGLTGPIGCSRVVCRPPHSEHSRHRIVLCPVSLWCVDKTNVSPLQRFPRTIARHRSPVVWDRLGMFDSPSNEMKSGVGKKSQARPRPPSTPTVFPLVPRHASPGSRDIQPAVVPVLRPRIREPAGDHHT